MFRTKIPVRRKIPVLSGQKVVLMDADKLNPGLAEFLHPKPQAKDKAVECKDHEAAGCKDHEVAGDNPPSNTTQAKAQDMEDIPSTTLPEAETMKQNPSGSNPTGPNTSQHRVSLLQELAKQEFVTEQQLSEFKQIFEEQERLSRIMDSLAKKMENFLADIRARKVARISS